MNIFIDESGSFVDASEADSWNCVAAYLSPESDKRLIRRALYRLKRKSGASIADEIKLGNIAEADYLDFLEELGGHNGVLFVVATDAGINSLATIGAHQTEQAAKIVVHRDKMLYEGGKRLLDDLAARVRSLSPQLYIQMVCQVQLFNDILHRGITYFAQRQPATLGRFRWRIDQKNAVRANFEETFLMVLLPVLQSISLRDPLPMLEGADYSHFRRFDFGPGKVPDYLSKTYGFDVQDGLNLGMLIREDLKFEDSKRNDGVQIADLLASGVRRCLRGGFRESWRAAQYLGRIAVQGLRGQPPLKLIGFADNDEFTTPRVEALVAMMQRNVRPMLAG